MCSLAKVDRMSALFSIAAWSVLCSYLTWVFYLSIMKLWDMRKAGELVGPIKYPAYLTLGIGQVLNALTNTFVLSLIVWELPQWHKGEFTVSPRTERLKLAGGWRGRCAAWIRTHFLAKADKSGRHN